MNIGEHAWEKPVYARMALVPDNYLRPMQNNLAEQFPERYTLRGGETWEFHSMYACSLQSLKPIPKNLVQRTRCCVIVDSTIPCDLLYDNIMPDVMLVTMPLSRLAVPMFAPEIVGSLKEPPPKKFVFANLIDHLACEGVLQNLPHLARHEQSQGSTK